MTGGDTLGTVPEGIFKHRIMVPFRVRGQMTVESIVPAGEHVVEDVIAVLTDAEGKKLPFYNHTDDQVADTVSLGWHYRPSNQLMNF